MNNKENEIDHQFKRVISAQAEVWEGSNGTVSEIKTKFDVKKKSEDFVTMPKAQRTPTKSKVAEIQQKIVNHTTRAEPNSTPSRNVNIPVNKVTEMKQKITEVGEKLRAANSTPSRSINIPINKVNEIRKLLASLEKGTRDNSDKALSSKKRAVIDARMNTVSDIMKWIEDMAKQNKQGNLAQSRKGIELPVNRVNEMKNWLLDFERHNKEHFIEGSRPGNKGTISARDITRTDKKFKQGAHNAIKAQAEVPATDETTHADVMSMIALLNDLDHQNKKLLSAKNISCSVNNHSTTIDIIENELSTVNQVQDVTANPDEISAHSWIKDYRVASPTELSPRVQYGSHLVEVDQLEEQYDVDISMLPRPSEDSMSDESEDWEDIFAELSISSDEGLLQADDHDSVSDENIEETGVRKLLDSFINCDDYNEQEILEKDSEKQDTDCESSANFDYNDHESHQSSNHSKANTATSVKFESNSVQDKKGIISPGFNFEADFAKGLESNELLAKNQTYLMQVMPLALITNETNPLSMNESKPSEHHPTEVYVEKSSSSVLIPWRGASKKIIIDTKASQRSKSRKGKQFGLKLLKVLKRIVRVSGSYESERSKQRRIALARTLSESEVASSVVSPLSRFSDDGMTPRAPIVQDIACENYLPTTYARKIETSVDVVVFKGSLTPDQSVASAFENALSPDSSEGSSASNYALVLAKSMNVTQHVQFMKGVFGSPTQRLGEKSGVVIGELSLVASSGEI